MDTHSLLCIYCIKSIYKYLEWGRFFDSIRIYEKRLRYKKSNSKRIL